MADGRGSTLGTPNGLPWEMEARTQTWDLGDLGVSGGLILTHTQIGPKPRGGTKSSRAYVSHHAGEGE